MLEVAGKRETGSSPACEPGWVCEQVFVRKKRLAPVLTCCTPWVSAAVTGGPGAVWAGLPCLQSARVYFIKEGGISLFSV